MSHREPEVIIMAELDWGGLHSQSHVVARGYVDLGYRVYYINRTLQRWPKWRHLLTRLKPSPARGVRAAAEIPTGLQVINMWVGPPVRSLRWLNRWMIRFALRNFTFHQPLFINYLPTYNSIDTARITGAGCNVYVCYHNFDADVVLKDVLRSEKQVIRDADVLFADSNYLVNRLKRMAPGKQVRQAPPGVYFEKFRKAWRGDEVAVKRKVCFFGGAGLHLDLASYNRLCDFCEVHFIAVVQSEIRERLDPRIMVTDPVPNNELPELLREMDILTILYRPSDYIDAVLPAKFFECIATGKPVIVSGLPEANAYADTVYQVSNDPEAVIRVVENLEQTHTPARVQRQFETGKAADFEERFRQMQRHISEACNRSTHSG